VDDTASLVVGIVHALLLGPEVPELLVEPLQLGQSVSIKLRL
jgi:hypothetical protein